MRCKACGAEIPEGMSVCLECGVIPDNTVETRRNSYTQGQRDKEVTFVNDESSGWLGNPLVWFTRLQGLQLIIYAYQCITAGVLFYYLNHPNLLFSRSGARVVDFLEKSANNVSWILIVIMLLSVVTLLLMNSYGSGFWQAGLVLAGLAVANIATEKVTDLNTHLIIQGITIALEIAYAVVLFKQLSRLTGSLDPEVSAYWDRLLALWVYAYIAAGALGFYMALWVKNLKQMEICIAIAYMLVFAIGYPVYKHLGKTCRLMKN